MIGGQRRQVHVLFADLVGSTSLAEQSDPEDLLELLDHYRSAAATAITRYGGRLHHTLGDGLMASWGYPRAREDDVVRAILAGLAVAQSVGRIAREVPAISPLAVRVGVHTGLAVIADTTLGDQHEVGNLIGEAPNLAARLQSLAAPGSLVISETTADLAGESFETVALGAQMLKGVSRPIRVFEVVATAEWDSSDLVPTDLPPIVGRGREVHALSEAWAEVIGGGLRVVVLSGEAGLGKSRLVQHTAELAKSNGAHLALVRCTSLHSGSAFYPVRRMLERAAGISAGDRPAVRRAQLTAFCDTEPSFADPDALVLLAELLGVPLNEQAPTLELEPKQRRERTIALLLGYLEGCSLTRPALIVVEDVHWSDPSTLELLSRLLARCLGRQRLVLVTARPPFALEASEAQVLDLEPLDADDMARLVAQCTPGFPPELSGTVVERAEGIPLFGRELAQMFLRAVPGAAPSVPPRLHDLLVARLDQRPDARSLAQVLAAAGTSVSSSVVERIAGMPSDEVRRGLRVLVESGVLLDQGPKHDPVYRFSHVLLRDAAYATMLRARRRAVHRAVAAELEVAVADGGMELNVLAHHLEQAGEIAASLRWWRQAAESAAGIAAYREAIAHLRHMIELISATGGVPVVEEIKLLVMLGLSLAAVEGHSSGEFGQVLDRARSRFGEVDAVSLTPSMVYPLWAYHTMRSEMEIASGLAERMWARFSTQDRAERAVAATMAGFCAFERGELETVTALLPVAQSADREPLPEPHPEWWSAVSIVLGVTQWLRGERVAGRALIAAAVDRADRLGFPKGPLTRAQIHGYAAWAALLDDNAEAAAKHAQQSMQEAVDGGYATWIAAASMHGAGAQARLGDPALAAQTLRHLLRAWRAAGAELFRPVFLRWLGHAYVLCGDQQAALETFQEGIDHARRYGGRVHEPELHREQGLLLRDLGRREQAVDALRCAVELSRSQGAASLLLRATSDLVETVRGPGHDERQALAAVLGQFQAGVKDADVIHARNVLGSS